MEKDRSVDLLRVPVGDRVTLEVGELEVMRGGKNVRIEKEFEVVGVATGRYKLEDGDLLRMFRLPKPIGRINALWVSPDEDDDQDDDFLTLGQRNLW